MKFAPVSDTSSDWQALQKGLHRFVQSRVPNDMVDDVVSDTLEAIIRNRSSLATASNPSAWIYATARSKLVDYYRKKGRERSALDALQSDPTTETPNNLNRTTDDDADVNGLNDCLTGIISTMAASDQNILRAIDLNRTRQIDFATQNNLALPTVKSRIQRARKRLRNRMIACCPDGGMSACERTCTTATSCAAD
jgi:RNA polymerase sigma-70 factor (ECF subfamily)